MWRFKVWTTLTLVVGLCCVAFVKLIGAVDADRHQVYLLGRIEGVPIKDGDRIQSTKRCVYYERQAVDNVHSCESNVYSEGLL
jgi:hypothetical protein